MCMLTCTCASNTGSLLVLNFEPLGGTLVLYNSEGRASMQGCSQEAKLVLWSLQSSLHLPKARTCTYLCLACQRNKLQYQSNPNPNFTMALLARVPPGVGPNIKERSKQGCSSRCGAGFPASVPRGILPQVQSPLAAGARLFGASGPQPPRAAPVSALSRAGLGNWCVQLPCPPPGQGRVRDWRGSARLRNPGACSCSRRGREKEVPFTCP